MKKIYSFDGGFYIHHHSNNLKLELVSAKKDGVLFKEEYFEGKKWEVRYDNGYPNLFYDPFEKIYRLYYTTLLKDIDSEISLEERRNKKYHARSSRVTGMCYAYSHDGVNFIKPNLNLVNFEGSLENNIISDMFHGASVFLDLEEKDLSKRYKLVTLVEEPNTDSMDVKHSALMAVYFSSDGTNFKESKRFLVYDIYGDTHNFVFKDKVDGLYKLVSRKWQNSYRIATIMTSEDFLNWSSATELLRGEDQYNQIYSMPIFKDENYYLGLASTYHEGNKQDKDFDTVDLRLYYSTTLEGFTRIGNSNLIKRGEGVYPDSEYDAGCIYSSTPVVIDNKRYFYYMGGNGKHSSYRETSFSRAYLEIDKYSYLTNILDEEASFLSSRIKFHQKEFKILIEKANENSYIEVMIKDQNEYIKLEQTVENGYHKVIIKEEYLNKEINLFFEFKDVKIYTFYGDFTIRQGKY